MATERTDPLAAQVAVMALADALAPVLKYEMHRLGLKAIDTLDPRVIAEDAVGAYVARFERFAGLRRVVLYGPLEVDPAAVGATHVPRAAA